MKPYKYLLMLAVGAIPVSEIWAAVPNSFILNEANTVSGGDFLEDGKQDPVFGRLEGNGQNWLEFLVVQGDDLGSGAFANTLDLRGWTLDWSYRKDASTYGAGTITFTQDPLWAAVPRGTLLTISEWQQAWYTPIGTDPLTGHTNYERAGGINGLGSARGNAYDPGTHHLVSLESDTSWNPGANGGGEQGDWHLHVYAGERNEDQSFKYFDFSGTVTEPDGVYAVGESDAAGLFAVNNDDWRISIRDAQNNLIQGPIGEHLPPNNFGLNSTEILKLESFIAAVGPELGNYLNVTQAHYNDGSSSTFGAANIWDSGGSVQDLNRLRDWLLYGDADLDGFVTGLDFNLWLQGGEGWTAGDFDGDGAVTGVDFNLWLSGSPVFGNQFAAMASFAPVPEPSSVALLASTGAAAVLVARRRRTASRRHVR